MKQEERNLRFLEWTPTWDAVFYSEEEEFEAPSLDELLQQIDQPKSPRLWCALNALGMNYVKETV